jgi:RNA polymerase sigma-70 factor (ECF subfamily)
MLGGRKEEAEDLTQETFLRAYKAITTFRGQSKFRTWLRRIATNLAINEMRKNRPLLHSLDFGDEDGRAYEIPDTDFSPEKLFEGRQALQYVEQALSRLSDGLRTVFVLKELEGYTHEETAQMLGVKSQAVRVRHHRAKKLLVKYLTEQSECVAERGQCREDVR